MIRRWRFGLRSRLIVIHLEISGTVLVARGLVRSNTRRIVLVERGLL